MLTESSISPALTRKDFLSSVDPRWCAGCGDYATLNILTRVFAESGIPRENFAVISGIGCSSRLPYYINAYGFHTLHGRAPTVATGLKLANPALNVWVATGDGDGLSIGGNHFIHLIRRNPNIKLILFNNQIYGLTKGQLSPTSPQGTKTKSSPYGSIDRPMHPLTLALGAGATFVARTTDSDVDLLYKVLSAAQSHQGVAVVEVLINCVIFNDGTFDPLSKKAGERLIYGAAMNKGIVMRGTQPESVVIGENGAKIEDVIIHDPKNPSGSYAYMLAEMMGPDMPVPLGVLKQTEEYVYEPFTKSPSREGFSKLMKGNGSWEIDSSGSVV
jgi:2-oxoglutarate ferredoxin oxidoreductase subunit beta